MFHFLIRPLNFRNIIILPFLILLLVGLVVPSDGQHGILSIKSISFLVSVMSISAYLWIGGRLSKKSLKLLLWLLFGLCFLTFWMFIAFPSHERAVESMLDQFKIFLVTLCVTISLIFIVQEKLLSYQIFLKTIIICNFIYSICKLTLITLYFIGFINLFDFFTLVDIRYMSMEIYGELSRLQTSVDIVTPYLIFFVLQSKHLDVYFNPNFKTLYILVSFVSIFFSFSRFLIMVTGISCFLYWISIDYFQMFKWLTRVILLILLGVFCVGYETIYSIFDNRFLSEASKNSDKTRTKQIESLFAEFETQPLIGKGMGSYTEKELRDDIILHSYEVQWLAFLMQFGVVGICVIVTPLIIISAQFLNGHFSIITFSFFALFVVWLLSGFTNPFLISLTSGIVYALFALTGRQLNLIYRDMVIGCQKNSIIVSNSHFHESF